MHTQDEDLIPRLWNAARAMFARMCAAVGEAAAIAARRTLSAQEARAIRKWLLPLEAMTRKVVIVEALALIERGAARGDTHACAARAEPAQASDMRVCHPAHPASQPAPPTLTLIPLPPSPVRIITRIEPHIPVSHRRSTRERAPTLRLWPYVSANAGPHVRDIGPNKFVHDIAADRAREVSLRRLKVARSMRRPESERLARRMQALARILEKPLNAARRLARKFATQPMLAIKLAVRRPPRTKLGPDPEYALSYKRAVNRAYDFGMQHSVASHPDSS